MDAVAALLPAVTAELVTATPFVAETLSVPNVQVASKRTDAVVPSANSAVEAVVCGQPSESPPCPSSQLSGSVQLSPSPAPVQVYVVVSGDEVVAKFYLAYRIDPDFEKILKQMYRSGICVGIKTFDPNIDDDMLSRRIRIERYPVRVLKCREIGDEPRVADRADSGIVSKRSAKALLGAFAVCGKVQTVTRVGIVLNFISLFAAAMVMGVTMLFGAADKIPSLYVALYQLFWLIPTAIISWLLV